MIKKILLVLILSCSFAYGQKTAIAIHGGAGTISRGQLTPEREKEFRDALENAVKTGYKILKSGGSSLDAVEAAVVELENNPLFNAARGAVFTHEGKNEMDASIMNGKDLSAGAITGVSHIKNPIKTARKVMENSSHVLLAGKGAEEFAKLQNQEFADSSYFFTQPRWDGLQKAKERQKMELDHNGKSGFLFRPQGEEKFGTVGAVALDQNGNLAAATSTGGMTNKRWNRIGDSPIIGAGTYANNATCAVSATGHGEFFIRAVVGYDISAMMEYKGLSLKQASEEVVLKKLVKMEGEGGVIAVDKEGNIAMPFNSTGMYRASIDTNGRVHIAIFKD